jgi:hypothetical protein
MFDFIVSSIVALLIPVFGMYGLNHFFPMTVPIALETWFALFLIREFIRN